MWTNEWPTEEGNYWVFDPDAYRPRVQLVKFVSNGVGTHTVGDSKFWYKRESPRALFQPADVPPPPVEGDG
jgi:hypothetical protein